MAEGSHDGESKVATLLAIFKGLLTPKSAKNSNAKVTQLLAPVARAGAESSDKKLSLTLPGRTSFSRAKAKSSEHTPLLRKRFFSDAGLSSTANDSDSQKLFGFSKMLLKGESGFLFSLAVQMVRSLAYRRIL